MADGKVIYLAARVKFWRDSPWREFVFMGVNGTWTWAGENDYYGEPCRWPDVASFLLESYAYEGLRFLDGGQTLTVEQAQQKIRDAA